MMTIEGALTQQLKDSPRAYYEGEIIRRARIWADAHLEHQAEHAERNLLLAVLALMKFENEISEDEF